jgi:hypothetical protein
VPRKLWEYVLSQPGSWCVWHTRCTFNFVGCLQMFHTDAQQHVITSSHMTQRQHASQLGSTPWNIRVPYGIALLWHFVGNSLPNSCEQGILTRQVFRNLQLKNVYGVAPEPVCMHDHGCWHLTVSRCCTAHTVNSRCQTPALFADDIGVHARAEHAVAVAPPISGCGLSEPSSTCQGQTPASTPILPCAYRMCNTWPCFKA